MWLKNLAEETFLFIRDLILYFMSKSAIGFLRGLGMVILIAVLGYLGTASNLTLIANPFVAGLIASVALAVEHSVQAKTGKALFGAIRTE